MDYLNRAYKEFAEKGTEGISTLYRENDSIENLINKLLALHIDKLDIITSLIKKQNRTYNELFELLTAFPDQIKFNKQLFMHRKNPAMNICFLYSISVIKPIVIPLFNNYFKLSEDIEYYDSV